LIQCLDRTGWRVESANDVDDSPGHRTGDPGTGGEGPDCSGFAFKVWRELLNESDAGAL
jgi:hypothetical protein